MDREQRRFAVSGASGLVGQAVVRALVERGDLVWPLVRGQPREGEIAWNPRGGSIDTAALAEVDAVIHLAGEPIAGGRWSSERKRRIRASRVDGTRLLAKTMAELSTGPRTLVCASATGYYGERGDQICVEGDPPGEGFLSQVCVEWEAAADAARSAGIRTTHLRIGMVLAREGGALASMLPIFRAGLGGPLGAGSQYWNWILMDDLVRLVLLAADEATLQGPINAVAPEPVSSRDFARELGRVLHRPAFLPAPAFAVRLVMGELADALLFTSTRAVPQLLLDQGFAFRGATLAGALDDLLGSRASEARS